MAERRMFAKTIIDSDSFFDMPVTARLLYYDLCMRADDDGFVNSPKKIMRMVGASQDDMAILITKKFVIPFDSGVVVIKHWRIHNYIQKDRYKETKYKDEKAMLIVKENDGYSLKGNAEHPQTEEPTTDRQLAYKESELPYSFDYKIRTYFVGKPCPICGKKMTYENNLTQPTIQHNIPISKGGRHEIGNISVICRSCNTSIKDNPTEKLNADEVATAWDEICIQNVSNMDTQVRLELGKSKSKDRVNNIHCPENDENSPNKAADVVIDYLNMRTSSRYKHSESSRKHIRARLNDGFTVHDCMVVIDKKCVEWMGTDYEKFLRPETLFGNKFESYLNATVRKTKQKEDLAF